MKSSPRLRHTLAPVVALIATTLALTGGGLTASAATATPAPAAVTADEPHGLKGEYFAMSAPGARDFATLGGVALDSQIDFASLTSTFSDLTGQSEHTTARWSGQIEAPTTDDYTFSAIGDNGFRLFIDEEVVIDHWEPDWDVEQTSEPVTLEAGVRHDIRLEYFQDIGGASMFLRWSTPSLNKHIVPTSALYPPEGFEIYPVDHTVGEDGVSMRVQLPGEVASFDELAAHLTVESDTITMPISSVAVDEDDPTALEITLAAAVQRGAKVRVAYDGEAGITAGGEPVPADIRSAINESTQRLLTPWGEDLNTESPLPEYPRPQLVRDRWLNLNGEWEFAGATADENPVFGEPLAERIIVPFPVESQLSGLERHEDHMFYRTLTSVPDDWQIGDGERLLLNFGAVDYEAEVWVNGESVAQHMGGYTAFSADITDALIPGEAQEIIVAVTDTTGDNQPTGKQRNNPSGIFYTPSSGIWQTVWLEPVADVAIDELTTTPDVDSSSLAVSVESAAASSSAEVTAVAKDASGKTVGSVTGAVGEKLMLDIESLHLWSPDDPYLYDLSVTLTDGDSSDIAESYFGMRSIEIAEVGGYQKIVLNGEPIFSLAMLDQGFWPDGLNTAPSDEALRFDLEQQKDLGFNAVRKHIKVEPARWYHHADQLGLLVWQDFVSAATPDAATGREQFVAEGFEMMAQVHNSPAVVGFIPFNEGWGEWDRIATGEIADDVKAQEPTRIINAHSGVNCCASKGDSGKGDIVDHHDYTNTEPPFPDANRAAMDGEHGGFTLPTAGHMWPGAPAAIYSGVADKDAFTAQYVENTKRYYLGRAATDLSGSVYTQITDLENEINGMWTYDRRVLKVDADAVRDINARVIAAGASAGEPVAPAPGSGSWPLDEGEGSTSVDVELDKSPLALTDGTDWTTGVRGSALSFNGDGEYAETERAVIDTTASYSVSAWVTLDELPGNYATAVSQDGAQIENPFYLQYGQGAFAFSMPGGNRARLETTPELGTWYHLVGVYDQDAAELKLYVNGEPAATVSAGPAVASTGPLSIGRGAYNQAKGDWWNGSIDEVRAFGAALTDAEVQTLYADVTDPTDPGETDPGETDPGETDPGETDPTDPDPTDPGTEVPGDGSGGTADEGNLAVTGMDAAIGTLIPLAILAILGGMMLYVRSRKSNQAMHELN